MRHSKMFKTRYSYFFPVLIFVLVLPSALALLYVRLTGDQSMRPLGITLSNQTANTAGSAARGISVQIDWGVQANSPNSQQQVQQLLQNALSGYGIDYQIKIRDTADAKIEIYFVVEHSRLGPYRLQNIAEGIPAALAAYTIATNP
ncbi:MAG: hypothetical protein ACU0C9_04865 [Paracoccaceae bacterium]